MEDFHNYPNWESLADPLLLTIFTYLDVQNLSAAGRTCKVRIYYYNFQYLVDFFLFPQISVRISFTLSCIASSDFTIRYFAMIRRPDIFRLPTQ